MNQSGVNKLTLYDASDTTFTRVSATEVANIQGTNIEIAQLNKPTFEAPVLKINRKLKFDYSFIFTLFGLDNSILSQLDNKFGWLVLIEFYNGDTYFLTTPSFKLGTDLNENETEAYQVTLKPNLPTVRTMEVAPAPEYVVVVTTSDVSNALFVNVTLNGSPVTDLIASNFTVNDLFNTGTITNTTHLGSGDYQINLETSRTQGNITVTSGAITGFGGYNYSGREIVNSGASGTTDWINPTSGLAEYWEGFPGFEGVHSIVTGSGFTGNAQRFEENGAGASIILQNISGWKEGVDYRINIKYRTSAIQMSVLLQTYYGVDLINEFASLNTGNASTFTSSIFQVAAGAREIKIYFTVQGSGVSGEIDEVELIEV